MKNVSSLAIDYDTNPPDDVISSSGAAYSRMPLNLQVPIQKVRACRDSGEAFRLACIASGLDDKDIYSTLGIDQGYFSNIRNGKATLKASLEPKFCQIVGNFIYPEWRAYQLGFTMNPLDGGSKDRIAALEDKLDYMISLLKAKGAL